MAKIAVADDISAVRRIPDVSGREPAHRMLARGNGWRVSDVMCSAGPRDRPFLEQHAHTNIAIVIQGSFQYRCGCGSEVMTPGSLLLGNAGQYFQCRHDHGVGDRCISFSYDPEYFERVAEDSGVARRKPSFSLLRVPALRALSSLIARVCAALPEYGAGAIGKEEAANGRVTGWEEIAVELAGLALEIGGDGKPSVGTAPAAEARVTRVVRMIEADPDAEYELSRLAQEARLSRFHFLRVFQQFTGLTPHQHVLRNRLRSAARRLIVERGRVLDIALDSGFGDVSNFNRAFRAEFGVSPRRFRSNARQAAI